MNCVRRCGSPARRPARAWPPSWPRCCGHHARGAAARPARQPDPVRTARVGGGRAPRPRCWSGRSPAGRRCRRCRRTTATRAATSRGRPAIAVVVVGVLYLGVASPACSVLGPAPGQPAPLADLLAIGVRRAGPAASPRWSRCCSPSARSTPTSPGPPGSARRWAATARCRRGSRTAAPGAGPRRSLPSSPPVGLGTLAVIAVLGTRSTARWCCWSTGAFTLVYVVGTAAALRLLPRGWAGLALRAGLARRRHSGCCWLLTGAHGRLLRPRAWRRPRGLRPSLRSHDAGRAEASGCPAGSSP